MNRLCAGVRKAYGHPSAIDSHLRGRERQSRFNRACAHQVCNLSEASHSSFNSSSIYHLMNLSPLASPFHPSRLPNAASPLALFHFVSASESLPSDAAHFLGNREESKKRRGEERG
ncbi:hypothetical protein MRX96_004465 [Rhipicephalus microplus]